MDNIKVGYQKLVGEHPPLPVTKEPLIPILESMASQLKDETMAIRNEKDKDRQATLKKKTLPAIIISASTTCRKASDDDERTGLILIDLDDFGGKANPDVTYDQAVEIVDSMIGEYPFVIGRHTSVRRGLKVACGIEPSTVSHKRSFAALRKLFADHGLEVDRSTSDEKRVNFLCWDADITETLIEPLKQWNGEHIEPLAEVKKKPYKVKRSSSDSSLTSEEEIGLCLEHLHPDDDYQQWYQVGMIIKEHGGSCAIWDSWSSSGALYKAGDCDKKWQSFKGGGLGFGTLVKWATDANGGRNPIMAEKNQRQPVKVTADDFDDVVVDAPVGEDKEEPPIYFHKGKYHMLDPEGLRYTEMGDGDLTRQLRLQGLSPKGADGEMSAVDKMKANIVRHNAVDHVGALAGRSIGLHRDDTTGAKHLITRKNNRVIAKQGDCSRTIAILEAQYGEQFPYLISWLHRSRLQLSREQFMQGHVLVVAGKPNGGKSLVSSLVFQPLLGQVAKAGLYLAKGNDFNADLVGSELLLLDDEKLSMRMEDRRAFGLRLKSVCGGSGNVSRHGKGADAYNVNPLWRIVILINDNDTDLGCLPPLGEGEDDTVGDKVLLLQCHKQPLPFAGEADQSAKLAALFKSEEQAFAYYVDNYEIPASIRTGSCRFGFDHYHAESLVQTLNANSNERTLLSATYDLIFRNDYLAVPLLDDISTGRKYWKGTALQWATILRSHKQHDAHGIIASALAYGDTSVKAGIQLGKVAEVSNGRVMKDRTNSGRLWTVWQPEDMDTVVADDDLF